MTTYRNSPSFIALFRQPLQHAWRREQKWINSTSQRRKQCPGWGVQIEAGWWLPALPGPRYPGHGGSTKTVFWGGRKNRKGRGMVLEHLGRCCASRKCALTKRQKVRPSWLRNRTRGQVKEGTVYSPGVPSCSKPLRTTAVTCLPSPAWSPSSIAKEWKREKLRKKKKKNSCEITRPLPLLQELVTYLCFIVNVPSERNGIISDLLNVADGIEAFFVVSWVSDEREKSWLPVSNVRLYSYYTVRLYSSL